MVHVAWNLGACCEESGTGPGSKGGLEGQVGGFQVGLPLVSFKGLLSKHSSL